VNDQLNIFDFIYMVLKSSDYVFKMSLFKKPAGPGSSPAGFPALACPPVITDSPSLFSLPVTIFCFCACG